MELKDLLKKTREELAKRKSAQAADLAKAGNKVTVKGGAPEALTKSLRKFGVKSLNELLCVNTAEKKFAYLGKDELAKVKQLKEDVDVCMLTEKILGIPVKKQKYFEETLSVTLKAFGIESGDNGFEWIPTMVADSYIDEFNLERKVAGLFTEVKMPSNPYKWPVMSNGAIARKVGQASAINKQTFNTENTIQFDAEKLAGRYELPEELSEDSAPDVIKVIRQELMEGQEKAMEIAILEGDNTATMHHFSQLPDVAVGTLISTISGESPECVFVGIRKRLLAATVAKSGVDCGASTISETELSAARSKMGKYGVDPSQLALITGPKVYNQMVGNLEDVRTLDKYGPQATVLTGELAKFDGAPVIVSEYLREDLGATGFNTSTVANNIKGSLIFINRKRWFTGLRRAVQYKVESNKTELDVLDMVSFSRRAFQATLKADGSNYDQESIGSMVYNIGL